jgi:hydroxymethylglutaryl-CoA synthase
MPQVIEEYRDMELKDNSLISIVGYGAYVPRFRIKREEFVRVWGTGSVKEKTVAGFDEDIITMAAEAAQNAMDNSGVDSGEIEAVFFASSSPPKVNGLMAPIIGMSLGCKHGIRFSDFFGVGHGGTAALRGAFDSIASGKIANALVVCSDDMLGASGSTLDSLYGAGAAAFVVCKGKGLARILGNDSYGSYFPYSWRNPGEPFMQDYGDPRFERLYGYENHVMSSVHHYLSQNKLALTDFNHLILPEGDGRMMIDLSKKLKATSAQMGKGVLVNEIGNLSVAGVFLSLAQVLAEAKVGERILLASYGTGSVSDVFGFEMLTKASANAGSPLAKYLGQKEYIDYARYARMKGILCREGTGTAVPTSLHASWRSYKNKLSLIGSLCKKCGVINYPSRKLICIGCRQESEYEDIRLERKGKIHTVVAVHYAPPGIEGPYAIGIAEFQNGLRILGRLTDCIPTKVEIDQPIEMVLRKLMEREGIIDYGYAFRPLREEEHNA